MDNVKKLSDGTKAKAGIFVKVTKDVLAKYSGKITTIKYVGDESGAPEELPATMVVCNVQETGRTAFELLSELVRATDAEVVAHATGREDV